MHIIKVTCQYAISQPTYVVVGSENPFEDAEKLHNKHYPESRIVDMEVVSTSVINQWAQ